MFLVLLLLFNAFPMSSSKFLCYVFIEFNRAVSLCIPISSHKVL